MRFRELAAPYGAAGISWWDFQETTAGGWSSLAAPLAIPTGFAGPAASPPLLGQGSKGDSVLWLQEHLASALPSQETDGVFGANTATNLEAFQAAHSIPPTGQTDPVTWLALLALPPIAVDWGSGPAPTG
jgi:peptidoglycan hydrolase-like protein with peptidoglycan-binding domain